VAVIAALVVLSRAAAIQRLFSEDVSQEIRVRLFFPLLEMGWKFFPFGSGFGSFVDLFKMNEPIWNLSPQYLNHAHNDLLELIIESGVVGALLLGIFFVWWLRRALSIWRSNARAGRHLVLSRTATLATGMMLIASLSDYPLRTPLMAIVFALCCCFMINEDSRRFHASAPADPDLGAGEKSAPGAQNIWK
jgi:O-antigen ligase